MESDAQAVARRVHQADAGEDGGDARPGRRRDQRGAAGADHLGQRGDRSATSSRTFADKAFETGLADASRCGGSRFSPLRRTRATGKTKRNKGRQDFTVLTINGRVRLWRRRWHSPDEGTTTPLDAWLDTVEGTISLGVREMACRLNGDGKNFDKAAANLARTAQVQLSGETLRVLVEAEGKRVLQAQRSGQLAVDWSAADCRVDPRRDDDADLPRQRRGHGAAGDRRREDVAAAEDQGEAAAARQEGAAVAAAEGGRRSAVQGVQDRRLLRRDPGASAGLRHAGRLRGGRAADASGGRPASASIWPTRRWATSTARRGSATRSSGRACRWTPWGWTSTTSSENVHKARREIYGDDDEAGKQWAGDLLHVFKHDGYEAAWQKLLEWRVGLRRGSGRRRIGC